MKNSLYSVKGGFELKDMDSEKKQVAIYLAKFDNLDSDFDIIRKGAFAKSLQERGVDSTSNRKIAFLRHHDWQQPIGKFITLEEDDKGLFAVGQLGNSSLANDAWEDYKSEIIREHSIGFKYVKDKLRFIEDTTLENGGYYEINEVILYEGSAVTFGANEETNVVGVIKSEQDKNDAFERLNKDINTTIKALTNGNFSDERGYQLEMRLKYLNNQLMLLATQEPFVKEYSPKVVDEPTSFDWSKVMHSLHGDVK